MLLRFAAPMCCAIVLAALVTGCVGDDDGIAALPPATATAAVAVVYALQPENASGFTVADLMSPQAGGRFDCTSPELLDEPAAISHSKVESVKVKDGDFVITVRYFNEPETISQLATFSVDGESEEITGLDDHAKTFLDPTQPSEDDC